MLSKDNCRDIIKKAVGYSKNFAVASISDNGERLTRFANSQIHQNVEISDEVISLTVYDGKKSATCVSNVFDDEALKQLASQADEIVKHVPEGEFEVVKPVSGEVKEAVNDERLAKTFGIEGRAKAVERCVKRYGSDFTASGALSLDRIMNAYGNSDGVFLHHDFNVLTCEAVATHKDGATGYGFSFGSNLDDCDIDKAFADALKKAEMALNPVNADIGTYTVVLEPSAVANLMKFIAFGLNGEDALRGTSYASGKVGQKLFGANITLDDDVHNPATYQRFFDADGNVRTSLKLIDNGVLTNLCYDAVTAKKAGVPNTCHAVGSGMTGGMPINLVMRGGDSSIEEMIAATKRGIYVTHFHYTNAVNKKTAQITGLTRDGTFLIEDGKLSRPITNMRFTQNLLEAFSNVTHLSSEVVKVDSIGGVGLFPAARIEGFHFTSGQE